LKQTVYYIITIIRVWLGVFIASKLFFLAINYKNFGQDFSEFLKIWWNGLRLDLSVAGYILVIPLLLLLIRIFVSKLPVIIFKIYFWIILIAIAIVVSVDPFFYLYWGQKANFSFTQFLGQENAGVVSIAIRDYLLALSFLTFLSVMYVKRWRHKLLPPAKTNFFGLFFLLGISFLMIRSGWSIVPINISSAFYSTNNLYNNTALNPVWNVMATEFERDKHKAIVFFDTQDEAENIWENRPRNQIDLTHLLRKDSNTNVVLIVLESFSAKVSGLLSGSKYAVTPHLDEIMTKGVSFTNAYASSFRSDKGLLALISGVPSGARQTLTNFPAEVNSKPNIFKLFPSNYHTSFYYGGNLEFANIKILFDGADNIWSEVDFKSDNKGVWGVHDEEVFKQFSQDFLSRKEPQFKMLFSSSSHEPFKVPFNKNYDDPYLNSINYTDSCLGVLMNELKASDKWNNTLVIITADHGTVRPDYEAIFSPRNFKIPLVLTGGVVNKDTLIDVVVSQIDIPATLAKYKTAKEMFYNQQSV